MRRATTFSVAVIAATACVLLPGCQYSYRFDVSGVLKDSSGQPVAGVQIFDSFDGQFSGERPLAVSGTDGRFAFVQEIGDYRLMVDGQTDWALIFSKDGLRTEKADLRFVKRPKSTRETAPVYIVVQMSKAD
jgi:hypothetical protein